MTRQSEVQKYNIAYKNLSYRMGDRRIKHALHFLNATKKGSLLDVSTGRGEMMRLAREIGFDPVTGTEAVGYLCGPDVFEAMAHDLPFADRSFDVVCMFDVMEHLLPSDTAAACAELMRVAQRRVFLTVHNGPHRLNGTDLHINRRDSYETWHEELKICFAPCEVIRHGKGDSISEMFEVVVR